MKTKGIEGIYLCLDPNRVLELRQHQFTSGANESLASHQPLAGGTEGKALSEATADCGESAG